MRTFISLIAALSVVIFAISMSSVSALEGDSEEVPVEEPVEQEDGENPEFEDGDTGVIDDCEGEIYLTPEAAEAASPSGQFHEHQVEGKTYYMLDGETEKASDTSK